MAAMEAPVGGVLRWTRAAFLAAVATLGGTVAHLSAGGYLPGPVAMTWLFVICLVVAASLLGRQASTLRVAVLVVTGQTFLHGALTAMSGHRGDHPSPVHAVAPGHLGARSVGDGRRVGWLHDQLYPGQASDPSAQLSVPAPVQHLLADLTGPHAMMAVAHLAAAAVMGLWIARGERALWAILSLGADAVELALASVARHSAVLRCSLRAALSALRSQELFQHRRHDPPGWRIRRPARLQALADLVIRRGPPALLAA